MGWPILATGITGLNRILLKRDETDFHSQPPASWPLPEDNCKMGAWAGRLKILRRAGMEPRNPGTSKRGTNDPGKPALMRWVATRQINQCLRSRPGLSCILTEKLMFVCPLKRQTCTQSHGKTVPSCDDADKLMFVSRSPVKLPWRPSSVKQIHFLIDAGWLSCEKSVYLHSLYFLNLNRCYL